MNDAEDKDPLQLNPPAKHEIYPKVSSRFMGAVIWLGILFIAAVVLVQNFSGYN